ncbi:class I SAM-dependent methyltransferase [Candidatus Binatus sp.]|uniref:class I SAM-dependent methyltransferase n=1 Tax=Candidatus Binatus sp. TaxID=2811406 RepID=UPI0039C8B028
MEHKDLVREEFTRQANDYATAPAIRDAEHLRKLVEIVAPPAGARVLEVATGPGHVAMAFAPVCREVVGIDLTDAPLKIAEKMRAERGLANVSFQKGDVESRLPFKDGEFDVVVCRFAVHHFAFPVKVISEMARVCRADGLVAVEDFDRQRTARARGVLQRIRAAARHVAYQRARDERTGTDDGRGGSRNSAVRVAWIPHSGLTVDQGGKCVAGACSESDGDGRARRGRRSKRRASSANRQ